MLHCNLFTSFIIVTVLSMKNSLFHIPVFHVFLSLVSYVLISKENVCDIINNCDSKEQIGVLEVLVYWYFLHVANSTYQIISVSKI